MISHHHRCVFVHVPKAAGESIEHAFTDALGIDWERAPQLLITPNSDPTLGPPYLSHLTAADYVRLKYLPQAMFDDYLTFATVRNPWARVVSMYRYLAIHVPFAVFVNELLAGELWERLHYFVRPQTDFVCDDAGNVIIDRLIRFENLAPEFFEVCDALGLPRSLPHLNASEELAQYAYRRVRAMQFAYALWLRRFRLAGHAFRAKDRFDHYTAYYDAGTRQRVAEIYRSDIEVLGYTF